MLQGLSEHQHLFVIVSKVELTSAAILGRLEKKHHTQRFCVATPSTSGLKYLNFSKRDS